MEINSLERHLGYWMRLVSNHVSAAFARALQEKDVSVAEWVALKLICEEDKLTLSKLAASTGMTRGAISKILDKLESKDLASRVAHPEDSRVQWLKLTRAGKRLVPQLTALADCNDRYFFDVLDESERASLGALLRKLAEMHGLSDVPIA
jgi:DNA-binding MarR family transcriptional regulator